MPSEALERALLDRHSMIQALDLPLKQKGGIKLTEGIYDIII
jgi:hypothetical protein